MSFQDGMLSEKESEAWRKNSVLMIGENGETDHQDFGQRDLPRVPADKVHEGMLLVMCEGLVLKAPKILPFSNTLISH